MRGGFYVHSYKAHKKNQPHNMFFTMFLVIDYVINLQMIMRIFPSVILISHFNIACDSKFIFYIKNMICFLMKIQINTKS